MKLSKVEYRNLSDHGGEHYYKSVRVGNFWSNNYIEYQSNAEKTLSIWEYHKWSQKIWYMENPINDSN